jgi:hypothetical protein
MSHLTAWTDPVRPASPSSDSSVAGEMHLAVRGVDGEQPRLDPLGLGGHEGLDLALVDLRLDRVGIGDLRVAELRKVVDDRDVVVVGERERVLDARVAAADDDDVLVVVSVGIVELVLHPLPVGARNVEAAEIALKADREHDMVCLDDLARGERDVEIALLAGDCLDLGVAADRDAVDVRGVDLPRLEHLLAQAFLEADVAAHRKARRRRHHAFTLLVLADRVGDLSGPLEDYVGNSALGGTGGCTETRRSGAHDCDRVMFGHRLPRWPRVVSILSSIHCRDAQLQRSSCDGDQSS